jgi:hypothetical protein
LLWRTNELFLEQIPSLTMYSHCYLLLSYGKFTPNMLIPVCVCVCVCGTKVENLHKVDSIFTISFNN